MLGGCGRWTCRQKMFLLMRIVLDSPPWHGPATWMLHSRRSGEAANLCMASIAAEMVDGKRFVNRAAAADQRQLLLRHPCLDPLQ